MLEDSRNIDRQHKTPCQGKYPFANIESSLERENEDSPFTRRISARRTLVTGGPCVAGITRTISELAGSDGLLEARSGDTGRWIAASC